MDAFLPVPPGSDFPLSNLPWGAALLPGGDRPTLVTAIGDSIVDVGALAGAGLLATGGALGDGRALTRPTLNAFLELGPAAWADARAALTRLLSSSEGRLRDDAALRARAVVAADAVTHTLPVTVGDYTDFYASRVHAYNCGCLFRGAANALHPNWERLPVGYAGRASTVVPSGTPIARPWGQVAPGEAGGEPSVRPSAALDFELEVAAVVGGPANALGTRVPLGAAAGRVFGFCLMNDWSARDIQAWEATPLGPFNGKNFGTTLGDWIVTAAALAPYAAAGPPQAPPPPDYLVDGGSECDAATVAAGGPARRLYDVELTADLVTRAAGGGATTTTVTRSNLRHLYWTFDQMVAHHTLGGCVLSPGDVLGSGTVSAPAPAGAACLLEATRRGADPVPLADGGHRTWLQDGDEVVLRARCAGRDGGAGLGWGTCRGVVAAARRV